MKAAYLMEHGGPEVMQYGDLPDRVAQPGARSATEPGRSGRT